MSTRQKIEPNPAEVARRELRDQVVGEESTLLNEAVNRFITQHALDRVTELAVQNRELLTEIENARQELASCQAALAEVMHEHRLTREARPVKIVRVRCPHREGLAYSEDHPDLGAMLGCLPCPCNDRSEVLVEYDAVQLPSLEELDEQPAEGATPEPGEQP